MNKTTRCKTEYSEPSCKMINLTEEAGDIAVRSEKYEIIFCLSGKTEFLLNGKSNICSENEMIIITPGMYCCAVSLEEKSSYISLCTSIGLVYSAFPKNMPMLFTGDKNGIFSAEFTHRKGIDILIKEALSENKNSFGLILNANALKILHFAVENEQTVNPDAFIHKIIGDYFFDVLNYIEAELTHIDEQQLAEIYGVSSGYMSRSFKAIAGISFREYVNFVRVNRAKELLGTRKYGIEEITLMLEFSSTSHFINTFKDFTGMTPGKYGRKYGKMERKKKDLC